MRISKSGHWVCANIVLLVVLVVVLSASHVSANQDEHSSINPPHAAQAALDAFAESLEALSASFEQSTQDASGYVIDRLDGVFYFQAPNRFRWAYSEPVPEIIVGDGERLWHYDPSLEQATVRAQPSAAESPILALTNPSLMAENYSIMPGEQSDTVTFLPKASDAPIKEARVRMEGGRPVTVEWMDNFGQVTQIVFSGMVINPSLDQALFQFRPPAGVDVLEGL
ncbi:MAG TPA: outer membrane lipoprotein chaperone LolA [Wenzhouxiangella sp.]